MDEKFIAPNWKPIGDLAAAVLDLVRQKRGASEHDGSTP